MSEVGPIVRREPTGRILVSHRDASVTITRHRMSHPSYAQVAGASITVLTTSDPIP